MSQRTLKIPREEARRLLKQQIEKGQQLLNRDINEESELEQYIHDRKRYNQYNVEMLKSMFGEDEESFWRFGLSTPPEWEDFYGHLNFYKEWDRKQVNELQGLEESLNLISESIQGKPIQVPLGTGATKAEVQLPEKVTAAWLWHNVPIEFWLTLVGAFLTIFILGTRTGQFNFVQRIYGTNMDQSATQPKVSSEEIKNKVDQLTQAHTNNVAKIYQGIVDEEQKAAQTFSSIDGERHLKAAENLRKALQSEDERFKSELNTLRGLE
jgi:hypothetical protein